MGTFLRHYWLPAMLSSELSVDGPPVRLRLLGEDLVAFRTTNGTVGVLDHRCPHRRASLFFGRNEQNGIRCVYHGWKFAPDGTCLDMANVPPHQDFGHKVRAKAYRTAERNGLIWIYMGDDTVTPGLPEIEATTIPEEENEIDCFMRNCNWLQSLEGDLDFSHVGLLHERRRGQSEYETSTSDWGLIYGAHRPSAPGRRHWRIGHFLFPFWTILPAGPIATHLYARAWVPIDDTHTMAIRIVSAVGRSASVLAENDPDTVRHSVGCDPNSNDWLGRFRLRANADNDYLIDRAKQRADSFSGIHGVTAQDHCVTESMGAITDWEHEHLCSADVIVALARRRLLESLSQFEQGANPPCVQDSAVYRQARGGYFDAVDGSSLRKLYDDRVAGIPNTAAS